MIDSISIQETVEKLIREEAKTIYDELKKMSDTYGQLENRIYIWKTENSLISKENLDKWIGKAIFKTIYQMYKDEVASLQIRGNQQREKD